MGLLIKPISLKDANAYVEAKHRHHRKATGHKFSLAVYDGGVLHGVAIVGRPLIGKKVFVCFKDGERGIYGTLGYVDEFSPKYDYRKPDYFYIGHT